MVEKEELEEFMEEEWKKQVTQEDSIDESVDEYLGEMGWVWSTVREKLEKDKYCFACKKEVEFTKESPPHVVQATKVDSGVVAFVSLCNECFETKQKELNEQEKPDEEEKK